MSLTKVQAEERKYRLQVSREVDQKVDETPEAKEAFAAFVSGYITNATTVQDRNPVRYRLADVQALFEIFDEYPGLALPKKPSRDGWGAYEKTFMERGIFAILAGPKLSKRCDNEFFTGLEALHVKFLKNMTFSNTIASSPQRKPRKNNIPPKAPKKKPARRTTSAPANSHRRLDFSNTDNRPPPTPSITSMTSLPARNIFENNEENGNNSNDDDHSMFDAGNNDAIESNDDGGSNLSSAISTTFSNLQSMFTQNGGNNGINNNFDVSSDEDSDGDDDSIARPALKNGLSNNANANTIQAIVPVGTEDFNGGVWTTLPLEDIQVGMFVKHVSNPEFQEPAVVEQVTAQRAKVEGKGRYQAKNLVVFVRDD